MDKLIIQEVESIITIGKKLVIDAAVSGNDLGHQRVQELTSITVRGGQLISRLYGSDSNYRHMFEAVTQKKAFTRMHSNWYHHIAELVGIFEAVEHDIKSGLLSNFRNLIQAEIFADFLDMAEYLLRENYKDASAVILGSVLENALRKIAESNEIDTYNTKGKPLTIDPLNVMIYKKGIYSALIQKQITSWANLRNDAAHGNFSNYDSEQVKQMLMFVQKFCTDFLK